MGISTESRTQRAVPVSPFSGAVLDAKAGNTTLADLSLEACTRTERVDRLRDAYFRACPEICTDRPLRITRLHRELGLFDQPRIGILDKARVYRRILEDREPIVWQDRATDKDGKAFSFIGESLFAGSTTTRFKGVILYPEFLALTLWPELHTMSRRSANPFMITPEEANQLNKEVFPYWLDGSILEWARAASSTMPAAVGRPRTTPHNASSTRRSSRFSKESSPSRVVWLTRPPRWRRRSRIRAGVASWRRSRRSTVASPSSRRRPFVRD